ncbi:hypothetical protein ACW2Q0_25925 [Nocardia sp. R16R-3T]
MGVLEPLKTSDEFPHEPVGTSTAPWTDTWWFVCRDEKADVIVETHLTLIAPDAARSATLVRRGAAERQSVWRGRSTIAAPSHGTDEVRVEVDDPRWTDDKRVTLHGAIPGAAFELTLTGRFDATDNTALAPGFLPVDQSSGTVMRNLQHAMRFSGWVDFGGERIEVSGDAFRDRSWGWREHNDLLRHGWISVMGHAGDASYSAIGFYRGEAREGEGGRMYGWVADAEGVRAAVDAEIVLDGAAIPTEIRLTEADGRELHLVRQQHLTATFLSMHEAHSADNERLIAMMNHHLVLRDADGRDGWGYANVGWPITTHPLAGMQAFPRREATA